MLGAIKYPDLQNGKMAATECFWYVHPDSRGRGTSLLKAYEQWADEQGCKKKIMVHLMDSMSDRLKNLYERKGYRAMEVHYVKEG
jgi:GNAT superfamily N-acetyltransferase